MATSVGIGHHGVSLGIERGGAMAKKRWSEMSRGQRNGTGIAVNLVGPIAYFTVGRVHTVTPAID